MQNLNNGEIHFVEFGFLPTVLTFASYVELLFKNPLYMRLFWNSILIVVPVVIGQILISAPAAYAFEYAKFKYKGVFYVLYIIVLILPMQVLLVPHYITANLLGTNNTLLAIILPALFNPFGVFLIRQQLKGFPYECIEAAKVDGANDWHLFIKIVLPNLAPIVASMSILTFAEYWNVVDQAVVILKNPYDEPLSAYLSHLIQGDGGMVFATSAFYLFLAIIVFMIGQEYLAKGMLFMDKTMLCVNTEKKMIVQSDERSYYCYAIKTKVVTSEDALPEIIQYYAMPILENDDILFISEKMVACTQGKAIPITSIQPGLLASVLSRFVTKSKAGIGLAMPETMQCAINECGTARILFAAAAGMLGKILI